MQTLTGECVQADGTVFLTNTKPQSLAILESHPKEASLIKQSCFTRELTEIGENNQPAIAKRVRDTLSQGVVGDTFTGSHMLPDKSQRLNLDVALDESLRQHYRSKRRFMQLYQHVCTRKQEVRLATARRRGLLSPQESAPQSEPSKRSDTLTNRNTLSGDAPTLQDTVMGNAALTTSRFVSTPSKQDLGKHYNCIDSNAGSEDNNTVCDGGDDRLNTSNDVKTYYDKWTVGSMRIRESTSAHLGLSVCPAIKLERLHEDGLSLSDTKSVKPVNSAHITLAKARRRHTSLHGGTALQREVRCGRLLTYSRTRPQPKANYDATNGSIGPNAQTSRRFTAARQIRMVPRLTSTAINVQMPKQSELAPGSGASPLTNSHIQLYPQQSDLQPCSIACSGLTRPVPHEHHAGHEHGGAHRVHLQPNRAPSETLGADLAAELRIPMADPLSSNFINMSSPTEDKLSVSRSTPTHNHIQSQSTYSGLLAATSSTSNLQPSVVDVVRSKGSLSDKKRAAKRWTTTRATDEGQKLLRWITPSMKKTKTPLVVTLPSALSAQTDLACTTHPRAHSKFFDANHTGVANDGDQNVTLPGEVSASNSSSPFAGQSYHDEQVSHCRPMLIISVGKKSALQCSARSCSDVALCFNSALAYYGSTGGSPKECTNAACSDSPGYPTTFADDASLGHLTSNSTVLRQMTTLSGVQSGQSYGTHLVSSLPVSSDTHTLAPDRNTTNNPTVRLQFLSTPTVVPSSAVCSMQSAYILKFPMVTGVLPVAVPVTSDTSSSTTPPRTLNVV